MGETGKEGLVLTLTDERTHSLPPRLQGLIMAAFFGYFLVGMGLDTRTSYWLLNDSQEGMAIITRDLWTGHNGVAYRYKVNGNDYSGNGHLNVEDPRYRKRAAWRRVGCLLLRVSPVAVSPRHPTYRE
jgi:hypothetical protein